MKRIHTDAWLKRQHGDELLTQFEQQIKAWERATDTAHGLRKLTPAERQQIDSEMLFARAWLADLKRAIVLKLPAAAAECAVSLTSLLAQLVRFDDKNERNALIPKVRIGEKHQAAHKNKALTRKQFSKLKDNKLASLIPAAIQSARRAGYHKQAAIDGYVKEELSRRTGWTISVRKVESLRAQYLK